MRASWSASLKTRPDEAKVLWRIQRLIMQSIFSVATRRYEAGRESARVRRRDGALKMDWTKPLPRCRSMGIETWLAISEDGRCLGGQRDRAESAVSPDA